MATSREILALIVTGDSKSAVKALDDVGSKADKELGRASKAGDKWANGLIKGGAVAVGVGAVGAAALFKLGSAASDLSETQNKVNVVFGSSADTVHKFGETSAQAVGLSKNAAEGAAATYGNLFRSIGLTADKSADMSVELVKLAGDLASFNNANPEDVLLALRSGLTGEVEPLRQFGVNLNDARLKQEALNLGLTASSGPLDAASKAQAAYSLILKDTALAQGDFGRTADGAANQQRIFRAEMENLQAAVGAGVLPVMNNLLKTATSVAGGFNSLNDESKKQVGSLLTIATGAIGAGGAIAFTAGAAFKAKDAFDQFAARGTRTSQILTNTGKAAGYAALGFGLLEGALAIVTAVQDDFYADLNNLSDALDQSLSSTGRLAGDLAAESEKAFGVGAASVDAYRNSLLAGEDQQTAFNKALDLFPDKNVELLQVYTSEIDKYVGSLDPAQRKSALLAQSTQDYANVAADSAASAGALASAQKDLTANTIQAAQAEKAAAAGAQEAQLAAAVATGAVLSLAQAFQILGASAVAGQNAASSVGALSQAAFAQFDATSQAESSLQAYNDSLVETASSSGGAGGATENLTQKFYEHEQKLTAVRDAQQAVGDSTVELGRSQRDATEAFAELSAAAAKYDQIINGVGAKSKTAKEAKRDAQETRDARVRATFDVQDAEKKLEQARKKGNSRDIADAELDLRAARRNLTEATEDAAEAQRTYEGTVNGFPKSSREAQDAQDRLTDAYDSAFDSLTNVREATDSAKDAATSLSRASDDLAGRLDNIKTGGSRAQIQSLTDKLNEQKTAAAKLAQDVGAAVATATGSVGKGIEATIATLKAIIDSNPRLRGAFDGVLANLQKELNTYLAGAYAAATSGLRFPSNSGVNPSRFRAKGGPVSSGEPYVVGEEGPELFVPKQSGTIIPNGARAKGVGISGGDSRTIYVVVNVDPVTGEQTVRQLQSYQRTNGPLPIKVA